MTLVTLLPLTHIIVLTDGLLLSKLKNLCYQLPVYVYNTILYQLKGPAK